MRSKLLFTFLFLSVLCQGQIVTIPDANFKARLLAASTTNFYASVDEPTYSAFYDNWSGNTSSVIDTNSDGEIQLTEALAIKCLKINGAGIVNLTGIESFVNLKSLRIESNLLTSLDVSQNMQLINLRCNNNQLTSLNVSNCSNILILDAFENQLTTFDASPCTSLQKLRVQTNDLVSVNVSGLAQLTFFHCQTNVLTNLDVSTCPALEILHCEINELETLNVSGCPALQALDCHINNLTSLDLTPNPVLNYLRTEDNNLTNLVVSGCPLITWLECQDNQLTTLDVSTLSVLERLECNNNALTSLDVSHCAVLDFLYATGNQLVLLNIKNGYPTWELLYFNANPTLEYVCADAEDVEYVESYILDFPNCHVNTYCTFTPGGTFYEVSGTTVLDYDGNGCTPADFPYRFLNFSLTDGVNSSTLIADESGHYFIPVGTGSLTVTPNLEHPQYFNISPESFIVEFPTEASPSVHDFCVTANGLHSDVDVVLIPMNVARPGFDSSYKIIYKNRGNQVEDGTLTLTFNAPILEYIQATPSYTAAVGNTFIWNYINLGLFETREITISFNVNSPTQTPAVNIDDVLQYTTQIITLNQDETPDNNTFILNQVVVGSLDPNDKTCLEGEIISPSLIGDYVHYMIRFENTGTFPAENIVVKDMIDTDKFDVSTLVPLHSSHDFVTNITGNRVEFIFEGINLPFDDAAKDGYVAFKIKTTPNLVLGNTINNSADIFFDYNFPVLTNTYTSTIEVLDVDPNDISKNIVAYPNPVKDVLRFNFETLISKVEVFDVAGRKLSSQAVEGNSVDLSFLKAGNYILRIYSDEGIGNIKISKQ